MLTVCHFSPSRCSILEVGVGTHPPVSSRRHPAIPDTLSNASCHPATRPESYCNLNSSTRADGKVQISIHTIEHWHDLARLLHHNFQLVQTPLRPGKPF